MMFYLAWATIIWSFLGVIIFYKTLPNEYEDKILEDLNTFKLFLVLLLCGPLTWILFVVVVVVGGIMFLVVEVINFFDELLDKVSDYFKSMIYGKE